MIRIRSVTPLGLNKMLVEFENGMFRVCDLDVPFSAEVYRISEDGTQLLGKRTYRSDELFRRGTALFVVWPGEITLADAAEKYGIPRSVLTTWVRSGVIPVKRRCGNVFVLNDREVQERVAFFYERLRRSKTSRVRAYTLSGHPILPGSSGSRKAQEDVDKKHVL